MLWFVTGGHAAPERSYPVLLLGLAAVRLISDAFGRVPEELSVPDFHLMPDPAARKLYMVFLPELPAVPINTLVPMALLCVGCAMPLVRAAAAAAALLSCGLLLLLVFLAVGRLTLPVLKRGRLALRMACGGFLSLLPAVVLGYFLLRLLPLPLVFVCIAALNLLLALVAAAVAFGGRRHLSGSSGGRKMPIRAKAPHGTEN